MPSEEDAAAAKELLEKFAALSAAGRMAFLRQLPVSCREDEERDELQNALDECRASTQTWMIMPEENLHEIFSRLDVRSAVTASSVCRHWRAMFDERLWCHIFTQDVLLGARDAGLAPCFHSWRDACLAAASTRFRDPAMDALPSCRGELLSQVPTPQACNTMELIGTTRGNLYRTLLMRWRLRARADKLEYSGSTEMAEATTMVEEEGASVADVCALTESIALVSTYDGRVIAIRMEGASSTRLAHVQLDYCAIRRFRRIHTFEDEDGTHAIVGATATQPLILAVHIAPPPQQSSITAIGYGLDSVLATCEDVFFLTSGTTEDTATVPQITSVFLTSPHGASTMTTARLSRCPKRYARFVPWPPASSRTQRRHFAVGANTPHSRLLMSDYPTRCFVVGQPEDNRLVWYSMHDHSPHFSLPFLWQERLPVPLSGTSLCAGLVFVYGDRLVIIDRRTGAHLQTIDFKGIWHVKALSARSLAVTTEKETHILTY